jgi:tRNA (mo5U34)-methyltransferase
LDVGTFDGFWAFQMEARGADAVFALDLPDGTQADWPPNTRKANLEESRATGLEWGSGFKLAHAALGSQVQRVEGNIYDLTPDWLGGPVDVVLCGTILQHLRDPVGALENMRRALVPSGTLLMIEAYSVPLTRRHAKRPVAEFRPAVPGSKFTWWLPNIAALRGMAQTAGFTPADDAIARHRPLRGAGRGDHVVALRYSSPS